MKPDELLALGRDYLSEYVATAVATLAKPNIAFSPVEASSATKVQHTASSPDDSVQLNPRLFSYVIVSLFFGYTLLRLIPSEEARPEFVSNAIAILVFWFMSAAIIHWCCRRLGGVGKFVDTTSISLQVFATLYVVASAITLALAAVAGAPAIQKLIVEQFVFGLLFADEPVLIYFVVQLILLSVYLPLALRGVHRLRAWHQVVLVGLVFFGIFLGVMLFLSFNVMMYPGG